MFEEEVRLALSIANDKPRGIPTHVHRDGALLRTQVTHIRFWSQLHDASLKNNRV
jgi:hypothetical protein